LHNIIFLKNIYSVSLFITSVRENQSFTFFLFPDLNVTIGPIFQLTGIGEFLFPLWLLIKGVNVEQWEKRALESA